MIITCDVCRVEFGKANNSNDTDEADAVVLVSQESERVCKVDALTTQLQERWQSRCFSVA